MAHWPRADSDRPILIAVTDIGRLDRSIGAWASLMFEGGVDLIQVREPGLHTVRLAEVLDQVIAAAPDSSRVQVNGSLELAERYGCGLHLPERAQASIYPARPYSRSVHSPEQARHSDATDFVVAGHVFATPSHAGEPGRGLSWLDEVVKSATVPVVAIGGIDATNAVSCLEAGAAGVAVIRTLTATDDPLSAARALRSVLDSFSRASEKQMDSETIEITLNGKPTHRPAGSSIQDLLHDRELIDRLVVVEINGTIIARSGFGDTVFREGDIVELVHFVGGG